MAFFWYIALFIVRLIVKGGIICMGWSHGTFYRIQVALAFLSVGMSGYIAYTALMYLFSHTLAYYYLVGLLTWSILDDCCIEAVALPDSVTKYVDPKEAKA